MGKTRGAVLVAFVAGLIALAPDRALAGEFSVGSCKADQLNYSTQAFDDFATRGMKIRRACDPEGPGLRGLITANVSRGGRVPRGAVALLTMTAPAGTRFTQLRWGGDVKRQDCRYSLQLWAEAPDIKAIPMKNVRANRHCPPPRRTQSAGYPVSTFDISGATRIVQRVICQGDRKRPSCSARGSNYILTEEAEVTVVDVSAPTATVLGDTPLARGEWVRGIQPLNYDAGDNVGVRSADSIASGTSGGTHARQCAFGVPDRTFAAPVPCPNGPGTITVDTTAFPDGAQPLSVRAHDTAGNIADSVAVTARVDNTPPDRVDVAVESGDAWRNRNEFAISWLNPAEVDRAPIAAATYRLCSAADGTSCTPGEQVGADIAGFGLTVPGPGEWTLSLWRRDAAGNQTEKAASVPVRLRYDPEPPTLGFEAPSATDPTLVTVSVTDRVSGLAGGAIEISPSGSGTWQALPTETSGSRLVARLDDAALAAGSYQLRARATDQAGNEASTGSRLDGQPMALSLPLRLASRLRAGVERERVVRRTIRRHGERRVVRRRVRVLAPTSRVRAGGLAQIAGRLIDRDGHGIAGAEVRVLSSSAISPEQQLAVLQTGADGRFRYRARGDMSRTLRLVHPGSPLVLPAERAVKLTVPARTILDVSRQRVLNGQAVTFTGRLRTQPAPPAGKLVELQARLTNRWQTFRTVRTDAAGRWAIRYRFKRTRGVQRFRFRVRLPKEAGYPFAAGGSRPLAVRVRGL
jgi:hypothetical protein